jgi:hypothetical protein
MRRALTCMRRVPSGWLARPAVASAVFVAHGGSVPWPWTAQLADQWFTDLRTEGLDATLLPKAPRLAASRPSAGRTCSTTGSAGG